ncbi:hypothetical protein [Roseovarius sp. Pro17]|uniref:hypothetical protein n=1 Tax=Roseovarius sp. Pro17 TaxID=3108175 RepID=UPI002D7A1739|nr:hypothetical protein [Roseovarius sp. Pro17]
MSDIDAMQSRIMAALERIGQGLDGLGPVSDNGKDDDEAETLRQQIEDEKLANAQLEERVKQLNARNREAEEKLASATNADATKAEDEAARAKTLKRLDGELQALRHANQQLRDNNAALREANSNGVAEPHLINKAMMAELDGLRASRAADRAEMDVILTELGQITGGSADNDARGTGMEDA